MINFYYRYKGFFWAGLVAALIYSGYLYFALSGNQFCDCVETEKESAQNNGRSHSRSYFYHK